MNFYLKSYIFCLHFTLYLHVWIRIQKAPEYGSNTDLDPQHCYPVHIYFSYDVRTYVTHPWIFHGLTTHEVGLFNFSIVMSATDMLRHRDVHGLSAIDHPPRQWICIHTMPKNVGMLTLL